MSRYVLDASALIALLLGERGGEAVEENIDSAIITAVNLGEVAQTLFRTGTTRERFEAIVQSLGLVIIAVDAPLAVDAAEFRETARAAGLSQADCICLALAKREGAVAITADHAWADVAASIDVEVRMVR